jgi:hypothetical protein
MIPILEPGNIPMIVFLTITLGIPIALITLVLSYVFEHIPDEQTRLLLPAAGAVLMLAVSVLFLTRYPPEEPYGQFAFLMMVTSFLLNALVILAPFSFFRRFLGTTSPYLILCFTVFGTLFLLTCFGFVGGEIKMPLDAAGYEREQVMRMISVVVAEVVTALLIYAGIAALGTVVNRGSERGE